MTRSKLPAAKTAALAGLLLATGMLAALPAKADVEFEERGAVAYLRSFRLQMGDAEATQEFLDRPRSRPLRIIYLDSRGGNPEVGMEIGRMIRERGLDTGFHLGHGKCVSACTSIFVGGVHRYYIGGNRVHDGAATRVGLGFHPPRIKVPGREEAINDFYQQMGTPGAASLRYRIYPRESLDQPYEGPGIRTLYFAGGRTAVRTGVATSTTAPPGLRD